ncbi:hypothetical protein [Wolbachia endosymbiont (group A) of Sphecodes monilicornis]|uniref:hypothetical protein n=1 Tax=Wolbachia endosymbiont (group A) of Sphecodes monilicornis TaxID=2954060 RepID=UPI0022271D57|nr:hypothetical protein [Wolbachia endosymbiont (group A) of Sphecodes monilicornis]
MKTNIDEPCAGNLQARFFRGSCSNKTQTRGVKLQLLPNKVADTGSFMTVSSQCPDTGIQET